VGDDNEGDERRPENRRLKPLANGGISSQQPAPDQEKPLDYGLARPQNLALWVDFAQEPYYPKKSKQRRKEKVSGSFLLKYGNFSRCEGL
jgi:hypothetical protein